MQAFIGEIRIMLGFRKGANARRETAGALRFARILLYLKQRVIEAEGMDGIEPIGVDPGNEPVVEMPALLHRAIARPAAAEERLVLPAARAQRRTKSGTLTFFSAACRLIARSSGVSPLRAMPSGVASVPSHSAFIYLR